ncbi:hypothetical protein [Parahaliea mediterranea]|uniref:hypothetical protein n=1 Tax=Parahaliea mediterranea TaxID=651086 RepID=UPI000E2E4B68|nr:hypothetical protein [Parahaliea mediterranea]
MDKLQAYKLDKAFTDGVELSLDAAPDVVFKVRLPSQYNRGYTQAVYGDADFDVDANGKVQMKGGMVSLKWKQEDAFFEHCLLTMDGHPIPEKFKTDYPGAVTELLMKANQLAADLDGRVGEAAKKSSTSSTGSTAGQDESDSTVNLSSVGS